MYNIYIYVCIFIYVYVYVYVYYNLGYTMCNINKFTSLFFLFFLLPITSKTLERYTHELLVETLMTTDRRTTVERERSQEICASMMYVFFSISLYVSSPQSVSVYLFLCVYIRSRREDNNVKNLEGYSQDMCEFPSITERGGIGNRILSNQSSHESTEHPRD